MILEKPYRTISIFLMIRQRVDDSGGKAADRIGALAEPEVVAELVENRLNR